MALIACPECGAQVSDRAPSCPHCGVPIAATSTPPAPRASAQAVGAADPDQEPVSRFADVELVRPFAFRIAGRRVPMALLLFWGGMTVGIIMKTVMPVAEGEESPAWRVIPWLLIWAGVLWFAITEGIAAFINRRRLSSRG